MAKATISFEDVGSKSVVLESTLEKTAAERLLEPTAAVVLALGARALFDSGLLAEAGAVAIQGVAEGLIPQECVLAHFEAKKLKDIEDA